MPQFDFGTINPLLVGGSELAADLNAWRDALHTLHAATARPGYAKQYMLWWDTAAAPSQARLKIYTGSTDVVLATLNTGNGQLSLGGSIAFNGLAISQSPPADPTAQPLWWHSGLGRMAVWTGSAWVDSQDTPALVSAASTPAPNFPANPPVNTVYQAANGVSYTWNGQRWVATSPAWIRASGDTMSGPFAITASPATATIRDRGAQAGSRLVLTHGGDAQSRVDQFSDPGANVALLMDFNPRPGNLSSDVNVRFFRDTNTTGRKKLVFFPGNSGGTAIGGIEVSQSNNQIMPYGPWNFTEKTFAAASFQQPFQLGGKRIWQNASSGQLLFKDGADPLNDADGSYLVPLASLNPPVMHTGQAGSSTPTAGAFSLTVPPGISAAYVTLIGAGGGGGGVASGANAHGGGGGGGGYLEIIVSGLTPGQGIACNCGAGGAGGAGATGGGNGGSTTFGAYGTAGGGGSGAGVASGNGGGGLGGSISTGGGTQTQLVYSQGGLLGSDAWNQSSGWGGSCGGYFAPNGDTGDGIPYAADGTSATAPGCGGGGAASFGSAATRTGGRGANGLIIVTWI